MCLWEMIKPSLQQRCGLQTKDVIKTKCKKFSISRAGTWDWGIYQQKAGEPKPDSICHKPPGFKIRCSALEGEKELGSSVG